MQDRLCVRSALARQDSRLSKPWLVCTRLFNARGLAFPPQQTAYAITDKYSIPRCYKVSVPSWIMFPQRRVLPLRPGIHKSTVAVKRMFGKHQLPSQPKSLSQFWGGIFYQKNQHALILKSWAIVFSEGSVFYLHFPIISYWGNFQNPASLLKGS